MVEEYAQVYRYYMVMLYLTLSCKALSCCAIKPNVYEFYISVLSNEELSTAATDHDYVQSVMQTDMNCFTSNACAHIAVWVLFPMGIYPKCLPALQRNPKDPLPDNRKYLI